MEITEKDKKAYKSSAKAYNDVKRLEGKLNPEIPENVLNDAIKATSSPDYDSIWYRRRTEDVLPYNRDKQLELDILDMLKDEAEGTGERPKSKMEYIAPPEEPFEIEDIDVQDVELPPAPEEFSPYAYPSYAVDLDYKTLDSLNLLEDEAIVYEKKGVERFEALKQDGQIIPEVIEWAKQNVRKNPFLLSGFMSEEEAIKWVDELGDFKGPKDSNYNKLFKSLMDTYRSSYFRDEDSIALGKKIKDLTQVKTSKTIDLMKGYNPNKVEEDWGNQYAAWKRGNTSINFPKSALIRFVERLDSINPKRAQQFLRFYNMDDIRDELGFNFK